MNLGWPLPGMEKHEAAAQLVSQNAAQLPQAGSQLRSAGNDVAVLHAWIRAAAGDHAAASATLAASVDHDRASSSLFNELQSLIDLAFFAEMVGDEVLATRRRDDLRQRAAELRTARPGLSMDWLRSAKAAPYRWSDVRLDAELQWLVKYEPTLLAHHRAKVIRIKSH